MSYVRIAQGACLALMLSACTTQSPYHSAKNGVGYSDAEISDTVYSVSYQGNAKMEQSLIEDFLLLRMADLTLEKDMDHFTIVLNDTVCATTVRTSPTTTCTFEHSASDTSPFASVYNDVSWLGPSTNAYSATATIILGRGHVTSNTTNNHDARSVIARLGDLRIGLFDREAQD